MPTKPVTKKPIPGKPAQKNVVQKKPAPDKTKGLPLSGEGVWARGDHAAGPFTFAGLWENWKDPESGEWLRTCTIITGEPNELVADPSPYASDSSSSNITRLG